MIGKPHTEFTFVPGDISVTEEMKDEYEVNGYVLIRGLLNTAELNKIREAVEDEEGIKAHTLVSDQGKKMSLWNSPGSDITGVLSRSQKIAGTMTELMGGDEIYHYHGKLIMKEPSSDGEHVWHQDYGYWYESGCLFPDMATAYIAIDKCTKDNGCLEVLRASHRAGRIEHFPQCCQLGADKERVEHFSKLCQHMYVELDPGDAIFFDCNLIHRAPPNRSTTRRYTLLYAYNKASNDPTFNKVHACYSPLNIVPDDSILACKDNCMDGKDFLDPSDRAVKRLVQMKKVH